MSLDVLAMLTLVHSTPTIFCGMEINVEYLKPTVAPYIPDQPSFHKVLDTTTSDGIEIRLWINQPTGDENILVSLYDIYVK